MVREVQAGIKRMHASGSARRRGLGRLLLGELERTAAERGVGQIVLNTGSAQPEAVALYRRSA